MTTHSGQTDFGLLDLSSAAGMLWVNPDLRNPEFEEALLAGPQALAERFRPEPVQSSKTSRVCRVTVVFGGVQTGVYVKVSLDRSIWDRLKHRVRPSRTMRALQASRMLERHGFQVPEIVAVGSCRVCCAHRTSDAKQMVCAARPTSFMATREVVGAIPVYQYLATNPGVPAPCSPQERQELFEQLGLTIGRMHSEGIVHGDLRPGNVLARRTDGRWEFFFLDNERTRKPLHLSDRLRLKNLVQVNMIPSRVSNTERLRFFHAYLRMNPRVRLRWRQWAQQIMRRTQDRFRRKGWQYGITL